MNDSKTRVYKLLSSLDKLKWNIVSKGLICGIVAGLLTVLYRFGIEYGNNYALVIYAYIKAKPLLILPWIALILCIGVFLAWIVKQEPMATGSGIPQVEGVILYGLQMKWYTILPIRFIGGILSAFCGLSLGREGPSIQIGAAGGQAVAKTLNTNSKLEENYLITGGAAAGLSAAFNAPLSGMVFALEEVHRSFSPLILISATTASLTADVISKYFFGLKPVLSFTTLTQLPYGVYLWLIPLGIVSGLSGALINKSLLFFQTLYGKIPYFLRPCLALMIALPVGLFLPAILGGGQNLVKIAENASSGMLMLLMFWLAKIIFTCISFGSGVPGGIFMPILAIGSLTGSIVGIGATYLGLPVEYIPAFTVCAMAGTLSGAVKAPLTSILLAAEMTGSLVHLLPVAACSFIALLSSDILKITPIYEALLERFIEKNNPPLASHEKSGLIEVPVEFGSMVTGKMICEINWPPETLIVGLKRGVKEIIPSGNTRILPGDYLVILAAEELENDIHLKVRELCHSLREFD